MDLSPSYCKKVPWLHKFVTITNLADGTLERCVRCGQKNIVKSFKGQVDVTRFARFHMREFLVPQHRLFAREYMALPSNREQRRARKYA